MFRKTLFALLVTAAAPAFAQDEPIVVTATGLDLPQSDVALDVVTIPREAIEREPSGRIENVLTQVAGFQLFRASDTRSGHPTSQGATLRGLGGNASSRALLILDGVPQSDPFGGWIAWPAYDAERIGRIRVTRGGGSGVHGPGALAGTIEMESLSAEQFRPLRASAAFGSRDSREADLGLMLPASESALVELSGNYARGDGFIPIVESARGPADIPARYEQYGGTARLAAGLGGTELQAAASYFEDERNRGFAFGDNRTRGFDASVRLVGRGGLPWEALAYFQDRHFSTGFASIDDARTTATQVLDQRVPATGWGGRFELRPDLPGDAVELRIGGDIRGTEGETRERFLFAAGSPTRFRTAGGETLTAGGFVDATLRAAPGITLTGSARVDHWRIDEGSFVQGPLGGAPDSIETFPDRDGRRFTGRAGLAWRPANPLTVRAAGYTGWRLPTLNELFRPFRVGPDATAANASLRPESLAGGEVGIDYTPASILRLSATAFYNRLDDAIANVTIANGPGVFPGVGFVSAAGTYRRRENVDAVEAAGIELDARASFAEWSLAFSYAFTDAQVEASGIAAPLDGLRPAQVPRHSASFTLGYARDFGPEASVTLRYLGSRWEDDLNTLPLDDALVVGARAVIPVYGPLSAELRAENLFDALVEVQNDGGGLIERAMPQTFWAGLRFSFF